MPDLATCEEFPWRKAAKVLLAGDSNSLFGSGLGYYILPRKELHSSFWAEVGDYKNIRPKKELGSNIWVEVGIQGLVKCSI